MINEKDEMLKEVMNYFKGSRISDLSKNDEDLLYNIFSLGDSTVIFSTTEKIVKFKNFLMHNKLALKRFELETKDNVRYLPFLISYGIKDSLIKDIYYITINDENLKLHRMNYESKTMLVVEDDVYKKIYGLKEKKGER